MVQPTTYGTLCVVLVGGGIQIGSEMLVDTSMLTDQAWITRGEGCTERHRLFGHAVQRMRDELVSQIGCDAPMAISWILIDQSTA